MPAANTWHIGLTRLVPDRRGGRWLCGLAIFALLLGFFGATGVFRTGPDYAVEGNQSAALFFCVIIAYIVPMLHYICARTIDALDEIGRDLLHDPAAAGPLRERILRKPRAWHGIVLGIGLGAGIVHNAVLAAGEQIHGDILTSWVAMVTGTLLTWIVVTLVIATLLDNARVFNQLARTVPINPFTAERLRPFGNVAVISTLAIIGALAAFPIMIFDAEIDVVAFLPGLLATVGPMLVLALLPILPLHARLRAAKLTLLRDANDRIAAHPSPGRGDAVDGLLPLLAFRREVEALPEWPFDIRTVTRLLFYLVIPPFTWIGAALIQHVVEDFL